MEQLNTETKFRRTIHARLRSAGRLSTTSRPRSQKMRPRKSESKRRSKRRSKRESKRKMSALCALAQLNLRRKPAVSQDAARTPPDLSATVAVSHYVSRTHQPTLSRPFCPRDPLGTAGRRPRSVGLPGAVPPGRAAQGDDTPSSHAGFPARDFNKTISTSGEMRRFGPMGSRQRKALRPGGKAAAPCRVCPAAGGGGWQRPGAPVARNPGN